MKKLFLVFSIFLIACTAEISSTQKIENKTIEEIMPEIKTETIPIVSAKNVTTATKPAVEEKTIVRPSSSNITLDKSVILKKISKGVDYTIEVVDVTEEADACLIKVNGVIDLINEDETKTVNGLKIYLANAYVLHSLTQDSDVCQLIIT